MSKSAHIVIWSIFALIVLAITTLTFLERTGQREELLRADQSIETGISLFKDRKYAEALEIFENIPSGSKREWYARYYQGSAHIMLKDYLLAVAYLDQALVLNPTNTQIMHALGVAYFKMGKLKMSKAYYASILEINPQDHEARGLLETMTNLEKRQSETSDPKPSNEQSENE